MTFVIHLSALSAVGYFFLALALFAAIFEIWALVDSITRPAQAYVAVGKQSKQLWLIINGVAAVVGGEAIVCAVPLQSVSQIS